MAAKSRTKNGVRQITLEGEMTIYNAVDTKSSLMDALRKSKELEINLSKVTEVDSAGVQLLLMTKREAGKNDIPFRLVNHSDAILEIFNLFQVAEYFGDPIVLKHKSE